MTQKEELRRKFDKFMNSAEKLTPSRSRIFDFFYAEIEASEKPHKESKFTLSAAIENLDKLSSIGKSLLSEQKPPEGPRDFLIANYKDISEAVDHGMNIRLDEIEILSVMSAYAQSERLKARNEAIDECITLLEEINREEIDVDTYLLSQLEKLKSKTI